MFAIYRIITCVALFVLLANSADAQATPTPLPGGRDLMLAATNATPTGNCFNATRGRKTIQVVEFVDGLTLALECAASKDWQSYSNPQPIGTPITAPGVYEVTASCECLRARASACATSCRFAVYMSIDE